jgi:teichuronic acid biosynthesis glycosyltransferase TuaC
MKILFLSWAYPKPNTPYLGIWAHQQALALARQNVAVDVVNMVPYVPRAAGVVSEKLKGYAEIPDFEQIDGIGIHHPRFLRTRPDSLSDRFLFRFFWLQSFSISGRLRRTLDFSDYRILHAHNIFPDGAMAYRLHLHYGLPYVLTLHDIDRFNSCPGNGRQRDVCRRIIDNAERIFAVSERVKNHARVWVSGPKLDKLHNTYLTGGDISLAKRNRSKTIVTIGSLIERKGIHILLHAFHKVRLRHPDWKLVIIGSGPGRDALLRLSESLNLQACVLFTGTLEHHEAMKRLSQASIFCLPSWNEAFGVVYAEAMSFGIPIVGSEGEGIEDIVRHGDNGLLVRPKDIEHLAGALTYLIENENAASRIGMRGHETVQELQPDRFGRKLASIYAEIVASKQDLHREIRM